MRGRGVPPTAVGGLFIPDRQAKTTVANLQREVGYNWRLDINESTNCGWWYLLARYKVLQSSGLYEGIHQLRSVVFPTFEPKP